MGIPSLFMAHSVPLLFTDASNLHRGSGELARLALHNTPYWMLTTTDRSNSKYLRTCSTAGLKEDKAMLEGRAHQRSERLKCLLAS